MFEREKNSYEKQKQKQMCNRKIYSTESGFKQDGDRIERDFPFFLPIRQSSDAIFVVVVDV